MIDWNKPVRRIGEAGVYRVLCTDAPGMHPVVLVSMTGSTATTTLLGQTCYDSCVDFENIPESVAPVEIQKAFEEGYRAGRNNAFGNDISQQTVAWDNSVAKSRNIGKKVVGG